MRKLELAIGVSALMVVGASAVLFLLNYRPPQQAQNEVALGVQRVEKTLLPSQILVKPRLRPSEDGDELSSAGLRSSSGRHLRVLYPEWKPGPSQVIESRPVTEAADYVGAVWSPTGMDLAFTRKDLNGVYLAGETSSQAFCLTEDARAGRFYRWNSDGMSLHILDADNRAADLTITGEKYPASEWPETVFERDNIIFYHPEDGEPVQVSGPQDQFVFPELSPDETKVVFQGLQTGIYVADIADMTVICVGRGENPRWLPDSSGLVYDIPVRDSTSVVDGDLWYASADGRERTNMTKTAGIAESHPAVSSNGEQIAFSSRGAIYVGTFKRARL